MKCVSLFTGCGGLDIGLEKAGFRVVFANDLDATCEESYRLNKGAKAAFYRGSISDISLKLMREMSSGEVDKGIDLLAGGPPCPPYSKSRFYRKEKPRAIDDPVGDETLNGYLKVLKVLKPKAFLFENVHGFAYKVHKEAFDLLCSTAGKLGYECSHRVINAADYGVPQIRQRFFMVGVLGKKFQFPEPTHKKPEDGELFTNGMLPWRTAGDVITDLDTEENADDTGHFAGGKHHDLLCQVPPGENYLFFTKERGHPDPQFKWRSRYWSFLLKLSPKMPSWTIQARRSNNMGPLHWRNRILRIEEVKRLQTFPDDWQLAGTVERQWRQVGNAVPPLLGEVLGKEIKTQLRKTKK